MATGQVQRDQVKKVLHPNMDYREKIVHMQNVEQLTRTFCGRRFYRLKHVTVRLTHCTCRTCWASVLSKFPGVRPGQDFIFTQRR
jgi:hypothetical protein